MKKFLNLILKTIFNSLVALLIIFFGAVSFPVKAVQEEGFNHIPVAMALDDNYVYPTIVSITSAMENANASTKYDFYIMHPPELKSENQKKIKAMENQYNNCKINLIDMGDQFKNAKQGRVTTPAYYRLALSNVLPKTNKIIWIDGDTLIFHDLSKMYNWDVSGYYYLGFLDPCVHDTEEFGVYSDHYICSGVMLVNLEELRQDNVTQQFDKFIEKYNEKFIFKHDQLVINVVCVNKIGILPPEFGIVNFYSEKEAAEYPECLISPKKYTSIEMKKAYRNPTILHCVNKPWNSSMVYRGDEWWNYAQKTLCFKDIQSKYLVEDGIYVICSCLQSDKVCDVRFSSKDNCAPIQLWSKNGTNAQKFKLTYLGKGLYTMKALCSGKMLDVDHSGKQIGTKIQQYETNGTDAQKWYIIPVGKGYYNIVSACNYLCMDVDWAKTNDGTKIRCWETNGTNAQKFKFEKAG